MPAKTENPFFAAVGPVNIAGNRTLHAQGESTPRVLPSPMVPLAHRRSVAYTGAA